ERLDAGRQRAGVAAAGLDQAAQPGRADHHGRAGQETGAEQLAARNGPRMVLVPQRLAECMRTRGLFADEHLLVSRSLNHCTVTAALPSTAVQAATAACVTVA